MTIIIPQKPLAIITVNRKGTEIVKCSACGHKDDIQCFDALGADEGCLFCNKCGMELEMA